MSATERADRRIYILDHLWNYMDRRIFAALVLLTMLVIYAVTASNYMHKYKASQESNLAIVSALEFIAQNHDTLEFPSCFRDLHYTGAGNQTTLYLEGGSLLGWSADKSAPYCWSEKKGYFDCEDLCSGHA